MRLRALPAKELAEAYANKRVGDSGWQGFYPVIDPSEDVIPASPFEIFRQGGQARVPMMVGSNTDEGSLLAPMAGLDSGAMWSPNPALPESSGAYGGRGPELAAMYPGLASGDTRATADLIGDAFGQYAPTLARHSSVVVAKRVVLLAGTRGGLRRTTPTSAASQRSCIPFPASPPPPSRRPAPTTPARSLS